MRKIVLIAFLLSFLNVVYAQNKSITKYFKNKLANKETSKTKGKYVEVTSYINDSIIHKEFSHVKSKKKIWTKSYLNDKPYGIWTYYDSKGQPKKELNYTFVLKYGYFIPDRYLTESCPSVEKLEFPILNNREDGLREYIIENIMYPKTAIDNGIQGKVMIQFTVDSIGNIGNISIVKGVCESIDRDAFRLIHSISSMQPAKCNGKNVNLYMIIPINYLM